MSPPLPLDHHWVLGTTCWHVAPDGGTRPICGSYVNLDWAYGGTDSDVDKSGMPICKRCSSQARLA